MGVFFCFDVQAYKSFLLYMSLSIKYMILTMHITNYTHDGKQETSLKSSEDRVCVSVLAPPK